MIETDTNTHEETFQVGEGAELTVGNISGRIEVRGEEIGEIRLRAVKHGKPSAVENTHIETSQEGNRVRVRTAGGDSGLFGLNRSVSSVDYTITVPRGCRVRAKAVSADIAVIGTQAAVTVETVSGDAEIADVQGECSISTVSGDVRGDRIEGMLTVRTTSGNVTASASNVRAFNFHSVSGDLMIASPLAAGEHYFAKTVSGDVSLTVPRASGATVQMKTVSGQVVSDLPAQIIRAGRRNWQGVINGGGANVELTSVSGDLRIHGDPATEAPAPSDAGATSEHRDEEVSAVLTALEQGEISVEEAMSRIKAAR